MTEYTPVSPALEPHLSYLKQRVAEEARAAVNATSIEVTLIHIALATAYAKRFGESSVSSSAGAQAWVDHNRVW